MFKISRLGYFSQKTEKIWKFDVKREKIQIPYLVTYISAGWHVCSDHKFFNGRSQAQNVRIPIHYTFWHMYFHKRRFPIKGIHFTFTFQM